MMPYFLQRLGLDKDADERAIRRAYARELKKIDQETDPAAFQSLRESYDAALRWAQRQIEAAAHERHEAEAEPESQQENPAPSYGPKKIVPRFQAHDDSPGTIEPPAPPPPQKEQSLADAEAEFEGFMQTFRGAVTDSGSLMDASLWQAKIEECLASERLINIAARDIFERMFANLLTQGWQPGHQVLFMSASAAFGWDEDRRRLLSLGGMGNMLEAALQQRALFDSQGRHVRGVQRELIQRLRRADDPSEDELLSRFETLENISRYFPAWLHVITDMRRAQRWHTLYYALPESKRRAASKRTPVEALPRPEQPRSSFKPWVVLLILVALSNAARLFSDSSSNSYMPPSALTAQRSQYNLSAAPHTYGDSTTSQALADPREGRPIPPPVSKAELAKLLKKPPTTEVCKEIGKMAYDYGVGTSQQDADLGSAFDRKVIACVNKGLWTPYLGGDPAIKYALEREQTRSASDMKRIQADLIKLQPAIQAPKPRESSGAALPPSYKPDKSSYGFDPKDFQLGK